MAANKRGDLGVVINYSAGSALTPAVGFAIADDYVSAPPGFTTFNVRTSGARPSDPKWGDYNTVRRFNPAPNTWVAGAHFINQNTNCPTALARVLQLRPRPRSQLVELLAEQVTRNAAMV